MKTELVTLKNEIEYWQDGVNRGIINLTRAAESEMNRKKAQYVNAIHRGAYTTLRKARKNGSVYELIATRPNGSTNYIRAKTQDELVDKLYDYYTGVGQSTILQDLFPKALAWKATGKATGKSLKEYNRLWEKYYKNSSLAKNDVKKIGAKKWKDFFKQLCRDNHLTAKKFNQARIVANLILTYCIEEELISYNVLRDLDYSDMPFEEEETYNSIKSKAFDDVHLEKVVQWCQEDIENPHTRSLYPLAILFNLNEGLRYAELAGLKWEDIDLASKLVTISRQNVIDVKIQDDLSFVQSGRKFVKHTKAHVKPKPIPLADAAIDILKEIKALNLSDTYVFPQGNFRYHTYNEKVKKAAEAAGLNPKDFHSHCIRATVATNLYKVSHDIKQVQFVMRHTTPGMSQKYVGDWWAQEAARNTMNDMPSASLF